MELLYEQQHGRSCITIAGCVFVLFLAACFALAAIGAYVKDGWLWAMVPGFAAAFLLFVCLSGAYSIVQGEVWSVCIDNEAISWSSPRWPRSSGRIVIDTITRLVILEGQSRLEVTTHDGSTFSIPCLAVRKVYHVFVEHFEHVEIEFIEDRY